MGSTGSKPLLTEPWRVLDGCGKDLEKTIVEDIQKLNPQKQPGIILLGPIGAGKSSFINSCLSIGIGRIKQLALTGSKQHSFTVNLLRYTDSRLLKNFRVMDCMGIEGDILGGLNILDTRDLLEGHIKIGYEFNQKKPINKESEYYTKSPDIEDKIHCVVLVLTAQSIMDGIQKEYVQNIEHLLEETRAVGLQRVLVLTKCDKLCSEVDKDANVMFRSVKVDCAVKKASRLFGIGISSIFPVINYEVDIQLSIGKNIPILLALRHILLCASDRVDEYLQNVGH